MTELVTYSNKAAQRTLDSRYMTAYHKQSQWAELVKLKETIGEIYRFCNHRLTIFDIGVGLARVPRLLSCVATWKKIAKYVGIDSSHFCVAQSKRIAKAKGMADKFEVIPFNAAELGSRSTDVLKDKYDLVVCTYFTAGDFKPKKIRLQTRGNGLIVDYDKTALKPNKDFVAVFKGAYELLKDNGRLVIGSIYCDNHLTRKIQEEFYKKCGMTIITSPKDSFTATREGFWSERFSQRRIYDYFSWISTDKIEITPLDDYNFAVAVMIDK